MLLVQLHPEQQRDDERLDYFLGCMPDRIRVAVELRHPSWDDPDVYALLERHDAAYVVMSGAGLACVLRATTDVVYVRMHGPDSETLYAGSYSDDDLRWWADRSPSGTRRAATCSSTSTTTVTVTPCRTRGRCGRCSGYDRRRVGWLK